jgi:hypothetical protein
MIHKSVNTIINVFRTKETYLAIKGPDNVLAVGRKQRWNSANSFQLCWRNEEQPKITEADCELHQTPFSLSNMCSKLAKESNNRLCN